MYFLLQEIAAANNEEGNKENKENDKPTIVCFFTLVKEDKRITFYIVLGYCHLSRSLNSPGTR